MTSGRNNPHKHQRDSPPVGHCKACDKRIFLNRKSARRRAKDLYPEDPPRAYRCLVNATWWHMGHLPEVVRTGVIDRGEYRAHKPGGAR